MDYQILKLGCESAVRAYSVHAAGLVQSVDSVLHTDQFVAPLFSRTWHVGPVFNAKGSIYQTCP